PFGPEPASHLAKLLNGMTAEQQLSGAVEGPGCAHVRCPSSVVRCRWSRSVAHCKVIHGFPPGSYHGQRTTDMTTRIGSVAVADCASKGAYQGVGGPAIRDCLTEILACAWDAVPRIIPDERPLIEETLRELCDREKCCLVVTTGGTGPAKRDVTPEA